LVYGNKDTEKYWVLYQGDLRKVGIEMKLQLLDWNAMLKNIDDSNFEAIAMSWGAGSVDLDPKQIWHSDSAVKGGSNFIGYKNPEVDKLIDKARFEADKKKRIPILREVYRKIAADVPYAFLFVDKDALYARSAKIGVVKDTYHYSIGEEYWWMAK
jgi:peptide/nickel transport system substrate-binding protein/microcin C transport system substrate-binding protein